MRTTEINITSFASRVVYLIVTVWQMCPFNLKLLQCVRACVRACVCVCVCVCVPLCVLQTKRVRSSRLKSDVSALKLFLHANKRGVNDKFHFHVHKVYVCCFCTHISSSELCFTSSKACQPMMCPSFKIRNGPQSTRKRRNKSQHVST